MLVYGKCKCLVMQMFVSCVHTVSVLNAALCMTCSLLMLVEDIRGDQIVRSKWRRIVNVMKRKSSPIGKRTINR